ncbi:MAG: DNA-processing protein DprA [Ignavibacteriae bacterium]|nr:MAG: DNA-processing protein DprA [Ignavibacteriota bacterium]
MIEKKEIPYIIALTHSSKLRIEQINTLLVKILHEQKISLEEFFALSENQWKREYALDEKGLTGIRTAKSELPNSSFLAEDLFSQGYEVLPLNSPEYSKTLKDNLKAKSSPPILYVRGNKQILQEDSIAIVGSRDASDISLKFTDNIAKMASEKYKVVVSGFAKGVDKQALDSALKYKGHSIIVLPQGIMTFDSGMKKYYSQITEGDVLVLSTFFPNAPWSVPLAMGRNPYIYGLAKNIYVAESGNEGGTWSGVVDGLKKGRMIFVRKPEQNESNANNKLIEQGAVPVDMMGNLVSTTVDPMIAETSGTDPLKEKGKKKKTGTENNDSQINLL